jgi:hypothetical protein
MVDEWLPTAGGLLRGLECIVGHVLTTLPCKMVVGGAILLFRV